MATQTLDGTPDRWGNMSDWTARELELSGSYNPSSAVQYGWGADRGGEGIREVRTPNSKTARLAGGASLFGEGLPPTGFSFVGERPVPEFRADIDPNLN